MKNPMAADIRAWLTAAQAAPGVWLYNDQNRKQLDLYSGRWIDPVPGEFVLQALGQQPYGDVVRLVTIYRLTEAGRKWINEPDDVADQVTT